MPQLHQPITAAHNIANFAVDLVVALGSDTVFSLTGGMAMHLNRAVAAHPNLKAVYCQHEQAVVAAAEGYAKAANFRGAGFAVVTAGPGVSNSVTSAHIRAHRFDAADRAVDEVFLDCPVNESAGAVSLARLEG